MDVTKQKYYNALFANYPDVVTIPVFRQMLGGISNSAARRLIRQNHVRHFCIKEQYLIPKVYIVEYLASDIYEKHCRRLKHTI